MVEITAAAMEDVAGIVMLEREVAQAPHWAEEMYRGMIDRADGPTRRHLLVARLDDEIVAFAVGKVVAEVAELESVAVRADVRRDGIGRALCAAVVAWAWEQGAMAMELEVRASSAGAMALYRGLGFVPVGRRPGYYARPEEDAVLMRLERGPKTSIMSVYGS